ncbi:hypothetical protein [Halapricum desulfuricans]|nr:hypothetical protein [Halapricum desulfuricans]
MTKRRKFLLGMGSLAAGGAAAIGSGAFTKVNANRTAQINIAGDSSALLALDDSNSANSDYVEYSTYDEAFVNIEGDNSELNENPAGINTDANTTIKDIFEVRNQGTQEAFVYVDPYSITPKTVRYPGNWDPDTNADVDWNGDGTVDSGDTDTLYFDPVMSGTPNGRRDGGSLTAVYDLPGRSGQPSFPDPVGIGNRMVGQTGDPTYNGWEWLLQPGESFEFGLVLNVPQGDDSRYEISMDLIADTEVAAEMREYY